MTTTLPPRTAPAKAGQGAGPSATLAPFTAKPLRQLVTQAEPEGKWWRRFGRRLVRLIRPLLGVVRPLGWGAIGAAVGSLLIGWALGWAEFVLIALGLAAALVVAAGFVVGRTGYSVALNMARLRVQVGDSAFGSIIVSNPSRRALLPSTTTLPVGQGAASFHIPRLGPKAATEELFQIPTHQRAVIKVGPVTSWRGDPVGLLRRTVEWTGQYELFVHPNTVSLDGSSKGFLRDLEGKPTDDLSSSDVAFHALREYVPGDDRRHIHWKTSARIGKFMVRQFEETRRSHLVVGISTNEHDYAHPAEMELAISAGASLALQAIKEEKDLTVLTSLGNLHTETGALLLDDCSRIEPDPGFYTLTSVATQAAAQVPDASVAVLIVGSVPTAAQLRAAMIRLPVDVVVVGLRCAIGAPLARHTLGDSPVIELGQLEDLPKGMRAI
ncbi:MAG: DUF58 domain-containing protein [Bifidobacteriaceae bacterium]|jgi:uncharacterized protein (DUF58 family)|nr:DUF58 domain-containing protein [Bifidobacteriaceae bacterium]